MQTVAQAQLSAAPQHDLAPHDSQDDFASDIPLHVAEAAFGGGGAGHSKARAAIATYSMRLAGDRVELLKLADNDHQRQTIEREFAGYRAGYRIRMFAYLIGLSRKAAQLIGAPARFAGPVEDPLGAAARIRADELEHYRARALAAIRLELRPRLDPVVDGNGDLLEQVQAQLDAAEALQQRMKVANALIRRHAGDRPAQLQALLINGVDAITAAALLAPDPQGRQGYREHVIKNNFGEIARLRRRVRTVAAARAKGMTIERGPHGRVEIIPAERRVRLYLMNDLDRTERSALHRAGFRPCVRFGCWQGPHDDASIDFARDRAGVPSMTT
jgi:hypothetical protein